MDIKKKRALSVVPLVKIIYKNSIASAPLSIGSGFFVSTKDKCFLLQQGICMIKIKKLTILGIGEFLFFLTEGILY